MARRSEHAPTLAAVGRPRRARSSGRRVRPPGDVGRSPTRRRCRAAPAAATTPAAPAARRRVVWGVAGWARAAHRLRASARGPPPCDAMFARARRAPRRPGWGGSSPPPPISSRASTSRASRCTRCAASSRRGGAADQSSEQFLQRAHQRARAVPVAGAAHRGPAAEEEGPDHLQVPGPHHARARPGGRADLLPEPHRAVHPPKSRLAALCAAAAARSAAPSRRASPTCCQRRRPSTAARSTASVIRCLFSLGRARLNIMALALGCRRPHRGRLDPLRGGGAARSRAPTSPRAPRRAMARWLRWRTSWRRRRRRRWPPSSAADPRRISGAR